MSYEDAPATEMLATQCAVCTRPLVDAVSVEAGIGPECRKRHGYDRDVPDDVRAEANAIVHAIAVAQRGLSVASGVARLRALGFDALADRIAERKVAVRVEAEGDTLVVFAPYREDLTPWRRVPGARWDRERKARVVPATSAQALRWALGRLYPGEAGIGPSGPFTCDPDAPEASGAPAATPGVSFAKLRSGGWGVRGPADIVRPGAKLHVATRAGAVRPVVVAQVVWTAPDGNAIASLVEGDAARA